MGLIDEEVVVAVAATTAVLSPRARRVARKGAVYGLAGALKAGDVVASAARGVMHSAQSPVSSEASAKPAAAAKRPPARSGQARSGQARSGARSPGGANSV